MFGQIHERIANERKKVIMLKHIKVTNSLNSWVKLLKESLLMYVINMILRPVVIFQLYNCH